MKVMWLMTTLILVMILGTGPAWAISDTTLEPNVPSLVCWLNVVQVEVIPGIHILLISTIDPIVKEKPAGGDDPKPKPKERTWGEIKSQFSGK